MVANMAENLVADYLGGANPVARGCQGRAEITEISQFRQ
jgi:hypothetical protein